MKLMKNWKRIIAGFMAAAMVFLSIDSGCITALAAEIQERNNEQEIIMDFPTGGILPIYGMESSLDEVNLTDSDIKLNDVQTDSNASYDWNKYSTKLVYNQLSTEWKAIWDDLDELCLKYINTNVDGQIVYNYFKEKNYYFTEDIPVTHKITSSDFGTLYTLFMASNPQYYFLGYSGYEYIYGNDGDNYIDYVGLGIYEAFLDGDARLEATQKFQSSIEAAYANLSSSATESEKLRHVHDYVVNNVDYNKVIFNDDNSLTEAEEAIYYTQSAYSALCTDLTVCAGYAEAVQLLCNGLGVDAFSVTSVDHMWNKVRVNDSWYNVDPTWADNGQTEGVNNPVYYGYYGRSDRHYEEDTNPNASSHIEEKIWDAYIPECIQDTNPTEFYEPGTFNVPTVILSTPVIEVTLNEEETYDVTITMDENYSDATIYYTLDGTEPSVASTKSLIYNGEFTVDTKTVIRAVAVLDGYYDSEVVEKKAIMTIENAAIQSHFYKELTFTWDALGELVDGYIINVYDGADNTKLLQSIEIDDCEKDFYAYDTKELTTVSSVYYEIYGYTLDDEQNKQIATNTVKTTKCDINVLTSPLDVDVKWYVTTSQGVNYLVINVEEKTQENKQDKLCLWYCTDENGVNVVNTFTLDMTDGTTEFKYTLDRHGMAYDKTGYVYITDSSKNTAFQMNGFAVGAKYKEPEIESIYDVNLQTSSQTTILSAIITQESYMTNFDYKYQWYVADSATSEGTAIEGATNSSYTVQIGSFDVKYYYCEVTTEYIEKTIFETNNGTKSEEFFDNHTRVEGALFETEITYEPISNKVFTGSPIILNEDELVLKNALNEKLILGVDYTVDYEKNINAGEATILVDFINEYSGIDDARINFTIESKTVSKNPEEFQFTDVVTDKTYIYNGNAYVPSMTVKDVARDYILVNEEDYTIAYKGNVDAGTATITLNFIGNYQGRVVIDFEIEPKLIENVTISSIPEDKYEYTGTAIIPELTITDNDNGKKLVVDKDYTVNCTNNTDAGTADVTVKFIGNYKGEDRVTHFNINEKNAADEDVLITTISDQEYTGNEIKPAFKVVYNDMVLTEGTDYTATYTNNVDVDEVNGATITLTFGNNYCGTRTTTFNIVARKAENLTYSEITDIYTYDGKTHTPEDIVIKNGEKELEVNVDYKLSYGTNIDAGKGTVIVSFDGFVGESKYYTGEKILEFTINPRNIMDDLDNIEVKVETIADCTYNGAPYKPGISIVDKGIVEENAEEENGKALEQDVDFQVSYENNINAGTATIIIDFIGNYEGETQRTFTINPKEILQDDIEVEAIANQIYSGKMILPSVVVKEKNSDIILRPNEDYTVSAGSENVYVGIGTVIISIELEGNYIYTGENIEVDFNITPRPSTNVKIETIPNQTYTGSAITPDLVVKDGDIVLVAGHDYHATYSNNTKVGTATVTITFDGNFTGDSKTATFTIIDPIPTSITSSVFTIDQTRNYISKITVGTTAHTLLSNLKEKKYVSMRDKNGTGISDATVLGTGMIACIMDGSKVERTYTIIVTGDTNGDGKINITDMIAIKACTLKKSSLSGAYEKAGDVNADGKINITDFIKVKATTLKKDTITGVSVN